MRPAMAQAMAGGSFAALVERKKIVTNRASRNAKSGPANAAPATIKICATIERWSTT